MKRILYTTFFAALFLAPSFLMAQNVLYIARNSPADGNDPTIIAGLELLGYTVTAIGAGEYTTTSHTDHNADVTFFGEYISSSGVTPFLDAGFPTPCVSLEGYCPRSNRWNLLASDDDFGQIREDAQYVITPVIPDHYSNKVIADHPIFSTAGLLNGDEFAWSTEGTALPEVVWLTQFPQAAATPLADISTETDLHTYWILEPDAGDATNPLNHRLVIWGVHDNGFAATTDDFWSVIDNSIKWVLGELSDTKETDILNQPLSVSPNPFTNSTQVSFSIKESAEIELRVFDTFGRLVSSDTEFFNAGEQVMDYKNPDLTTGIYFYSLYADGLMAGTGKMMVK